MRKTTRYNPTIVNLSHLVLSETQAETLDFGLQFIPTPQTNDLKDMHASIKRFARHIHLRYFYGIRSTKPKEHFIAKSTWNPPCQNEDINKILEQLEDFSSITNKHRDSMGNLSESQLVAISTLKRNPSIIIKPADKGSATVIMSKKNYIAEAERQLSNQKHYAKLDTPVYPQTAVRISATLDKLRRTGYISKKQREYLKPPDTPRPRLL